MDPADCPYWFTEYALDMLQHLRKKESKMMPYYLQSPQIAQRQNLVELMITIAEFEGLSRTTVHLSVYLLDIFMDNHSIFEERLKLIAVVCLLLGSKIEERESKILKVSEMNSLIKNLYPQSDYMYMEYLVLKFMNWTLLIPTSAHFVEFFLTGCFEDDDFNPARGDFNYQLDRTVELVFEFINSVPKDTILMHKPPSKVAAACIAAARISMNLERTWTAKLLGLTKYDYNAIESLVALLLSNKFETWSVKRNHKRKLTDSGYLSS